MKIKKFADFVNEQYEHEDFTDEELRQAERDTLEYDRSLDADPSEENGEEEEEE